MKNKQKETILSLFNTFEYLLSSCRVFLLFYGILLFDFLEIIVYKHGVLDTDFSTFFNMSKIPFLLLFLVVSGVIVSGLSYCANVGLYKLYVCVSSKIKEKIKSWPNLPENSIDIGSLREIALITENKFLMKYLDKETKQINVSKKNYYIIYSLLIALLFNFIITLISNNNTILKFVYDLYADNSSIFTKILLTLFLIPVILTIVNGLKNSLTKDETKIYYPDIKYKKLLEEKELLLRNKS